MITFKMKMFNKWLTADCTVDEALSKAYFCIQNNIPWDYV